MKKVVMLGLVFMLQGLSSFGQTNAAPSKAVSHPVSPPASAPVPQVRKTATTATNNLVNASAVPAERRLSHGPEIQPEDMALFRRIKEEGLLTPGISRNARYTDFGRDRWSGTESIFRSDNDQMGDSCIRDTYVMIFPTGR